MEELQELGCLCKTLASRAMQISSKICKKGPACMCRVAAVTEVIKSCVSTLAYCWIHCCNCSVTLANAGKAIHPDWTSGDFS